MKLNSEEMRAAIRAAERWDQAQRDAEIVQAFIARHFPAGTVVTQPYRPDSDDITIRIRTGARVTDGAVKWLPVSLSLADVFADALLLTAQKHWLALAHDRGGYS